MNIHNKIHAIGIAKVEAIDRDGNIVHSEVVRNKVVTLGLYKMLQKLHAQYSGNITQFKIGSGTTAPAAGDTDLQTPVQFTTGVYLKAKDSHTYPTNTKVQYQLTVDFPEANGSTLSEVGLFFDDNTTIFSRFVHQGVNKNSFIKIVYTYTVELQG